MQVGTATVKTRVVSLKPIGYYIFLIENELLLLVSFYLAISFQTFHFVLSKQNMINGCIGCELLCCKCMFTIILPLLPIPIPNS